MGNSIGDIGLSAINIAYPVTALIQAVGTGIGMSGAVLQIMSTGLVPILCNLGGATYV